MPHPGEVVQAYRQHGLRVTPQRQAIFDAVHHTSGHVTAAAIYDQVRAGMPTISLKTVYETLYSLSILGLVQKLELGTGSMLFDTTVQPHHHLVCRSCHRIEDVNIDVRPVAVADLLGFSISSTDVIAWGFCPECRQAPPAASRRSRAAHP
jgi:Fur family peroxide stress response transcriptional regulator